jgi:hypothetical protein
MASGATRVSDLEAAEHLGYDAGKGVKRVSVFNDGVQVNAATEETLQAIAGLVPDAYDYIALTYVAAGNGAGEIETVVYKTGGSGGTTVATLTLAYDANNNLSSVTKT